MPGGTPGLRDAEEVFGVGVDGGVERVPRFASQFGERLRRETHHPGFAGADAAVGVWGEVWRVGLDHDAIERRQFRGFAEVGRVFVGDDAGEGDGCAEVEDFLHIG